jgi:hypothetical protein
MTDSPAPPDATLIFVYNADSGLFNTMADAAHKVFSPGTYACNLCQVTYGWMTEKRQWREFVASLGIATRFLHRDEFAQEHPGLELALPAVLHRTGTAAPTVCIDAEALNACRSIDDLVALVRGRCIGTDG